MLFSPRFVVVLASSRHSKDLGGGCHAGATLGNSMLEHRGHARAGGGAHDRGLIGFGADQVAYLIGDFQDLEHPGAAAVTGPAAALATGGFVDKIADFKTHHRVSRIRL